MSIKCPECGHTMTQMVIKGENIDVCKNCHWVYLDSEDLSSILTKINLPRDLVWAFLGDHDSEDSFNKDELRLCPDCHKYMEERIYESNETKLKMNFCKKCYSLFICKAQLEILRSYLNKLKQSNHTNLIVWSAVVWIVATEALVIWGQEQALNQSMASDMLSWIWEMWADIFLDGMVELFFGIIWWILDWL